MNKEQIFSALAPVIHERPIKALSGAAWRFKEMSGSDREALSRDMGENYSQARFMALVTIATVVDERGQPVFSIDDVDAVKGIRAHALEEIATIAMRLNNIGEFAEADAAKN